MTTGKESFFKAHWDWLVAVLGLAAVAAVVLLPMLVASDDDVASNVQAQLNSAKPAHDGVEPADPKLLQQAFRSVRNPPRLGEVDAKKPSFLASERRIFCRAEEGADPKKACGRPIPAEATECPFCHTKQPALVKIEVDSDHDGLPNEWELQYGFNPNDAKDAALDADADGFTNLEEYEAKTDPKDPKSHPDYLDFVSVQGTLKQTFLPFYFKQYNPVKNTYRLTFQRLDIKSMYDRMMQVEQGAAIKSADGKFDTGYVAKNFVTKETEVPAYKGSKMMKKVKVGFVDIERVKDGKKITLREGVTKIPVETQLDIAYEREGGKTFTVSNGAVFEIHGVKYRVKSLETKNGKPVVTIQDETGKKQKIIQGT